MSQKNKNALLNIIHWTWGFIQTLIGFIVYLFNYHKKHIEINSTIVTEIPGHWGGITLGKYVFVDYMPDGIYAYSDQQIRHEYGHSIQSLILGPFWLLIIGFPSLIWAGFFAKYREKYKVSYYSLYTEKWADKLGGVQREEK